MRLWHDRGRVSPTHGVLHLLTTLACLFGMADGDRGSKNKEENSGEQTYQEQTFSNGYIKGKTIKCEKITHSYYSAPMWTCKNMKVGDLRLRYWVGPGVAGNYHCGVKMDQWKARNDFGALCRHMMVEEGINVKHTLWAAVVSEASCENSEAKRLLFVRNDDRPNREDDLDFSTGNRSHLIEKRDSESHVIDKRDAKFSKHDGAYGWEEFDQGRGYVVTFRCMMLPT